MILNLNGLVSNYLYTELIDIWYSRIHPALLNPVINMLDTTITLGN